MSAEDFSIAGLVVALPDDKKTAGAMRTILTAISVLDARLGSVEALQERVEALEKDSQAEDAIYRLRKQVEALEVFTQLNRNLAENYPGQQLKPNTLTAEQVDGFGPVRAQVMFIDEAVHSAVNGSRATTFAHLEKAESHIKSLRRLLGMGDEG